MMRTYITQRLRTYRPSLASQLVFGLGAAVAISLFAVGSQRLTAQVEGDRGIAPLASSNDLHASGISVNTTGDSPEDARQKGWKEAARIAWKKLGGPDVSDSQIDSMVSAIVVEREQVGPKRYIATLGVIFDRARAGQYVGGAGAASIQRSAPLLVIPILYSGGTAQVFEVRTPWQKAWAHFQPTSAIDYVRPTGGGAESLILNAGQAGRRSRLWWRVILDQFGAADVIMPVAHLQREYPGGPVAGTFTARYGPDDTFLETFTLSAKDEAGVPQMLNAALLRFDAIYTRALGEGRLRPDPTLVADTQSYQAVIAHIQSELKAKEAAEAAAAAKSDASAIPSAASDAPKEISKPVIQPTPYTVQFSSPDAQAVDSALAGVRGVAGVQGASTSSIAIGGTSVMRVNYAGDINALASALRARGWQVSVGGNALRIRR